MDPRGFVDQIELATFAAVLLGTIGGLLLGVLLVQGKRIPAVLPPVAVALPGLVAVAFAWHVVGVGEGASLEQLRVAVGGSVGNRFLFFFLTAPVAGLVLLFLAIAGVRRGPRRVTPAVVGALLVIAVAAVCVGGGYANQSEAFGWVRAAIYLGVGVLVVVALVAGGGDEGSGAEAAAAAGLVFPLVVAAGETALRSLNEMLMSMGLGVVEPALRQTYVIQGFAEGIDRDVGWSWAAIGLALAVGAVGLVPGGLDRRRLGWGGLGLAAVAACAVAFFLLGDIDADLLIRLGGALG